MREVGVKGDVVVPLHCRGAPRIDAETGRAAGANELAGTDLAANQLLAEFWLFIIGETDLTGCIWTTAPEGA